MKSKNTFYEHPDGHMVGVTSKGQQFYFDKEDFDVVSQFTWRINNGYAITGLNGLLLHRIVMNVSEHLIYVDHINHNPLDNRKSNLRECNNSENQMNRSLNNNNGSGFKGVHWSKYSNKWNARIQINKKRKSLGYFNTKEEAAKAYNNAASFYFGEFACLNNI